MAELVVIVRFAGRIVDDRCLPVRGPIRLGEAADARVGFPGADLLVTPEGDALRVTRPGGRDPGFLLAPGEGERFRFGRVGLTLVHRARLRLPSEWAGTWDPRFLAVTLLVVAAGTVWAAIARRLSRRSSLRFQTEITSDTVGLVTFRPSAGAAAVRRRRAGLRRPRSPRTTWRA